jgi:hypothetical protein
LFRRTLPLTNFVACLLFVWLREPANPWYLRELDRARQRGAMFDVDDIWGTLACRTLNNWGPIHGGEALGVAVLEVLNLPSLLLTGFIAVITDASRAARITSACQWSWLLAGVFIVIASAQWWFIGRSIDARGGRLNVNPLVLAFVAAPFGAVPVTAGFQVAYGAIEGDPIRGTALMTSAVVFAYFIGVFLLPVWWVFEKAGWRGWRYYVPTGACAGALIGLWGGADDAWWPLIFVASGMSSAIVFSIALAYGRRLAARTG